jgi:hypothetical protein
MRLLVFGSAWPGFVGRCGLLVLLPIALGCAPARGKVTGQVRYNGQPVPGGRVTFRPADPRENSISAEMDEQGRFETVLPVGEVKVTVDNRELESVSHWTGGVPKDLPPDVAKNIPKGAPEPAPSPSGANPPNKLPGKYRRIPPKYYQLETSELAFTVKGGEQEQNLELTDR